MLERPNQFVEPLQHQQPLSFLSLRESNRSATTTNERLENTKRLFVASSIRENTGVKWKIAIQRADRARCARCIIHRCLKTIVPAETIPRGNSDELALLCIKQQTSTTIGRIYVSEYSTFQKFLYVLSYKLLYEWKNTWLKLIQMKTKPNPIQT